MMSSVLLAAQLFPEISPPFILMVPSFHIPAPWLMSVLLFPQILPLFMMKVPSLWIPTLLEPLIPAPSIIRPSRVRLELEGISIQEPAWFRIIFAPEASSAWRVIVLLYSRAIVADRVSSNPSAIIIVTSLVSVP